MAKQPEIEDIDYIVTQLAIVRQGALQDLEIGTPMDTVLFQLTDDLQAMVEYYVDHFGLEMP